jgi:dipeptidyl aminopeptidase/acylaminoacyl peptidase
LYGTVERSVDAKRLAISRSPPCAAGHAEENALGTTRAANRREEAMSKPVTFYSEGVRLAGDLFLPADLKAGERRAGIVLCHGYTGVRTIYLPDNAGVLAAAGYVVLTFDYKGWGDSDGPKSRLAPHSRTANPPSLEPQPGATTRRR